MKRFFSIVLTIVIGSASARAERIDFSGLSSSDVSDGDGQAFLWTGGGHSGTVIVRANWPDVTPISGALRTDTRAPASFASPFVGSLTLTFSEPVELILRATFPSLLRDGLNNGRFERVQIAAAAPTIFSPLPDTTAVYAGAGTNTIIADDLFSQIPTVSDWGFVSSGPTSAYQFQYTSTSLGLSETFDVIVAPEPAGFLLGGLGLTALLIARRRQAGQCR
jgi:hypothetical protein